ncbi:MAG: hypothetical protein HYS57_00305 [Parcubacteria group bacterium]|nr:hypothetical protein [Parcubacteria group bacterium]
MSVVLGTLFLAGSAARATGELVVYLSFETSSFAPLEYRSHARTLPTSGSQILFTADLFRTGAGNTLTRLGPENYLFEWTWRGFPYQTLGKNLFAVTLATVPDTSSADITLRVRDRFTKKVLAEKELSVPIIPPLLLLHEVRDGIVSKIAQSRFRAQAGETLRLLAQPYFFNVPADSERLEYEWRHGVNSTEGMVSNPRILDIKIPDGGGGYNEQFSVAVRHKENVLESASQSFTVEVEK